MHNRHTHDERHHDRHDGHHHEGHDEGRGGPPWMWGGEGRGKGRGGPPWMWGGEGEGRGGPPWMWGGEGEGRGGPPWMRGRGPWGRFGFGRRAAMAFWMARQGRGPFGGGPFGGPHFGGPFGGGPFDGDGGPRRRHRRGDIKFALLELLAEQPRHGYDLIKELESRYAGFYRPSPGSVYPTLQLLEDAGQLTSEQVEGKRIYTITASGRQALAERQAEGDGPGRHGFHPDEGGPGLDSLRRSSMALVEVVMQAARHGSPEQIRSVMQVLDRARRDIYATLAGEQASDPAE